jgi:hypothetical protein
MSPAGALELPWFDRNLLWLVEQVVPADERVEWSLSFGTCTIGLGEEARAERNSCALCGVAAWLVCAFDAVCGLAMNGS